MIKTIIFDNGGVFTRDPWLIYLDQLKKKKLFDDFEKAKNDLLPIEIEAIVGRKSFKDFQKELIKETGDRTAVKDLAVVYPLDKKMVELAGSLATKYEIALFTNDLGNFIDNNRAWKFEEIFGKNIFYSSGMGLRKPDTEAFNYVLESLGRKPEEILFIDDKSRNTDVAERLGMKSFIFTTPEKLRDELKNLLK